MSRSSGNDPTAEVRVSGVRDLQPVALGPLAELLRCTGRDGQATLAVKVVRRPVPDESRREVLQRLAELRTVSSRAGLVPIVLQGLTSEDQAYVVRLWSRRPTLADELGRGPLAAADVLRIGVAVTQGLAELHAAGLAHGNVCPANVLLLDGQRPALADAGIVGLAHLVTPMAEAASAPSAFPAPAVLRDGQGTAAGDVHALGRTLAAALGSTDARPEQRPGVPGELQRLVQQLTAQEPQWRPSASEVLDELQAVAGALLWELETGPPPEATALVEEPPLEPGPQAHSYTFRAPADGGVTPPTFGPTPSPAAATPVPAAVTSTAQSVRPDEPGDTGMPVRPRKLRFALHGPDRRGWLVGLAALAALAAAVVATATTALQGRPAASPASRVTAPARVLPSSPALPTATSSSAAPSPVSPTVAVTAAAGTTTPSPPQRTPSRPSPRAAAAPPPAKPAGSSPVPAPTGLAVVAGNGGLAASWNPPATAPGASPIVSFNLTVRRIADGAAETISVPVVNPGSGIYQPAPGLANNLAYTVTVVSIDQGGRSSAPVSAGPVVPHG